MTDDQPGFFAELKRRKVYRVGIAYAVVAWIALQFLDLALENFNAPDWMMQTIMAVFAIGFPVALVLAWAFEVTQDGVRSTPGSNRAFKVMIAVITIGAIGLASWSLFNKTPTDEPGETVAGSVDIRALDSIAVLPFESFSENQSDEYFADGLADTLLHKLAQLPNLKVIARNSSFQFKGTNKDAREIGESLEVAALVEGSVQRQGDQVRVIAQLIDTADGAHIWSATFDDTMQNIFELQDRLAGEIMMQLQISISDQDRKRVMRNGTDSPEAYDLLLRANQIRWTPDREVFNPDTDPVLDLIDRALEIDPDYAQAWTARSEVFSSELFSESDPSRAHEYLAAARSAAERAIESDPEYALGYVALGMAHFRARDQVEASRHLVRALELDPACAEAMRVLGLIKNNDDPQMALDLFTRARELDPESSFVYRQIFFALRAQGRIDEGLAILLEGIQRFPDHPILLSDVFAVYLDTYGRPDEAARWASRIVESNVQSRVGHADMAAAWFSAGDAQRARDWMDLYADRFPDSPGVRSRLYAIEMLSGNAERAREIVETTPQSPSYRFDRSVRIGGACLVLGDTECMLEHAGRMQTWLDEFAARGQPYSPGVRYQMAILVLQNAAIADVADRDVDGIESMLELTADWPVSGGRGPRNVDYLRVMLYSLLGDDEAAIRELGNTLALENGGLVPDDIFRLPPSMNPLITRLENSPGYEEWRADFNGRREGLRGAMVSMERSGEILSADDVAL